MKHADKDRDPNKARKRARNDANTALRKLREHALAVGAHGSVSTLDGIAGELARVFQDIDRHQQAQDARQSA